MLALSPQLVLSNIPNRKKRYIEREGNVIVETNNDELPRLSKQLLRFIEIDISLVVVIRVQL